MRAPKKNVRGERVFNRSKKHFRYILCYYRNV
ncbi:hypothetical protein E4T88_01470 [Dysgonomonas mossii]|uniref:Uncharacterized protein n=1 Tax=Dysgonomonas mossii TaxID=163665 RepID=A0A4Y9ISV8_9BACT|nr:hypothetical protein E4T88_01470 [Dysgonomonas mossii]